MTFCRRPFLPVRRASWYLYFYDDLGRDPCPTGMEDTVLGDGDPSRKQMTLSQQGNSREQLVKGGSLWRGVNSAFKTGLGLERRSVTSQVPAQPATASHTQTRHAALRRCLLRVRGPLGHGASHTQASGSRHCYLAIQVPSGGVRARLVPGGWMLLPLWDPITPADIGVRCRCRAPSIPSRRQRTAQGSVRTPGPTGGRL